MNNKKVAKNKNRDIRMAKDFIKLNEGQKIAFLAARSGQNMFITGGGGVGKSFLINTLSKYINGLVLLAPTGIAALNITGQTIHSFFGFSHGYMEPHEAGRVRKQERGKLRAMKVLLIDEISMVRADLLDNIDAKLRNAKGSNKPFGGVQVIFVGDFCQLKPILNWRNKPEVYAMGERYGDNIYAYNSRVWNNNKITPYVLTEIKRTDETDYVRLLRNMRFGHKLEDVVAEINANASATPTSDSLRLCTTNDKVNEINEQKFRELKGDSTTFKGRTVGEFTADKMPVPDQVELKIGARVIVCANGGEYVNGDIGTVLEITMTKGVKEVKVELDRGVTVRVVPFEWQSFKFNSVIDKVTRENIIEKSEAGSYVQIPLKLAYALTIHKAQGQTLDHAHVDFGNKTFSAGQGYVALSRVRSLSTLSLERNVRVDDIKFDPGAVEFTKVCSITAIERKNSDLSFFKMPDVISEYVELSKEKFVEIEQEKKPISDKKRAQELIHALSRHLDSSILDYVEALEKQGITPIINVTATARITGGSFVYKGVKYSSTEMFGKGFIKYLGDKNIPVSDLPDSWVERISELSVKGKEIVEAKIKKEVKKPKSTAQKFLSGALGF